jgi:hypothetical protein
MNPSGANQVLTKVYNADTNSLGFHLAGAFLVPVECDAFTVTYPNATTEIYAFRSGGTSGTVIQTVTIIYTDSTKMNLLSGVVS